MTMAERRRTRRVFGFGVLASMAACSQDLATSMLKRQVSGALGSLPPRVPVNSSLGAAKVWA